MPTCWAIDGVEPLEVVSPSSEDQLSREVASANADGAAIFPRGGGTRIDLGGIPSRPGKVIDMTGIDQVVAHNYADLTATFQAGLTMRQVSQTLSRHGQMLAVDPPIPGRATIGGTLATGVSGPLKWHFGHPRDTVIGMKDRPARRPRHQERRPGRQERERLRHAPPARRRTGQPGNHPGGQLQAHARPDVRKDNPSGVPRNRRSPDRRARNLQLLRHAARHDRLRCIHRPPDRDGRSRPEALASRRPPRRTFPNARPPGR